MTNTEFRIYLNKRLIQVRKDIKDSEDKSFKDKMAHVEKDLVSMLKIVDLGGHPARRVRRDYERNLARRGINIAEL